jgi:hypothetical protein
VLRKQEPEECKEIRQRARGQKDDVNFVNHAIDFVLY